MRVLFTFFPPVPTVPYLAETLPFLGPPNFSISYNKGKLQGLGCGEGFGGSHPTRKSRDQGAVKGVYLKGLFAQSRLFYREMDCPVRSYREMDCPVRWSLATPSALESQNRAQELQIPFASADATRQVTCKCEWQWAGDRPVF